MKCTNTTLLVEAAKRAVETLEAAALRGTRAKPTVAELNTILDSLRAALKAEAR